MASFLFTRAPKGLTLEGLQQQIKALAENLDLPESRRGFVVRVGPILEHPATKQLSFLVSFTDRDDDARRVLSEEFAKTNLEVVAQNCNGKRDPYLR